MQMYTKFLNFATYFTGNHGCWWSFSVLYSAVRVFSVVYGIVLQFSLNLFKTNSNALIRYNCNLNCSHHMLRQIDKKNNNNNYHYCCLSSPSLSS